MASKAKGLEDLKEKLEDYSSIFGFDFSDVKFPVFFKQKPSSDEYINGAKGLGEETTLVSWSDSEVLLRHYDEMVIMDLSEYEDSIEGVLCPFCGTIINIGISKICEHHIAWYDGVNGEWFFDNLDFYDSEDQNFDDLDFDEMVQKVVQKVTEFYDSVEVNSDEYQANKHGSWSVTYIFAADKKRKKSSNRRHDKNKGK